MKKSFILAITAIIAISLTSCKSQYDMLLNSSEVDLKYEGAFTYFNSGKYIKAAALFESLTMDVSGTPRDDTVQYYLGLSNYSARDYTVAEANFYNFTNIYPRSSFAERARYLRLDCLYNQTYRYELDQQPTYKAMSEIDIFLREYPETEYLKILTDMLSNLQERLDRKSYEAAKLYYTIEDYRAATTALKTTLKDNPANQYREDILYHIVMANYKYAFNSIPARQRERYMAMVDEYYNFIGEYPESLHRAELDGLFKNAQNYLDSNKS